ncbi:hypothetical protein HF670_16405 [Acidithiobacillus thiooxidans]|nr:hypothetical protein [Acidithiobacillus thiooxidans]MBU2841077.1 hypothetical protein [Acidithiobacillus thiooxidans]
MLAHSMTVIHNTLIWGAGQASVADDEASVQASVGGGGGAGVCLQGL